MHLSSGTRLLLGEAASWVVVASLCVGAVVYFDQIKAVMHTALGTDPSRVMATTGVPAPDTLSPDTPAARAEHGGYVVELKSGSDGHYHAEAEINGRAVQVLVDTGATMVAMTYEDAEAAGIFVTDKDFTHRTATANGAARVAPIMLNRVTVGDITVRNVRGVVSEPGALGITLLGMSFLGQLERVDMRSGTLILED